MSKQLVEEFGWNKTEASKVWFFSGTNCIVDCSHAVQYLHEVKDSIKTGFEKVVFESVMCGEPLRGVRFNLMDGLFHSDSVHRGGGQIIPTTRRVLYAAILVASPRMVEPVYAVDVQTEKEVVGKIYSCLAQRRGGVMEEVAKFGTPLCMLKGWLPVLESFGFTEELREATSGRAFPQLVFDHWQVLDDERGISVVMDVRKRKHMKESVPVLEEYNDKL